MHFQVDFAEAAESNALWVQIADLTSFLAVVSLMAERHKVQAHAFFPQIHYGIIFFSCVDTARVAMATVKNMTSLTVKPGVNIPTALESSSLVHVLH